MNWTVCWHNLHANCPFLPIIIIDFLEFTSIHLIWYVNWIRIWHCQVNKNGLTKTFLLQQKTRWTRARARARRYKTKTSARADTKLRIQPYAFVFLDVFLALLVSSFIRRSLPSPPLQQIARSYAVHWLMSYRVLTIVLDIQIDLCSHFSFTLWSLDCLRFFLHTPAHYIANIVCCCRGHHLYHHHNQHRRLVNHFGLVPVCVFAVFHARRVFHQKSIERIWIFKIWIVLNGNDLLILSVILCHSLIFLNFLVQLRIPHFGNWFALI